MGSRFSPCHFLNPYHKWGKPKTHLHSHCWKDCMISPFPGCRANPNQPTNQFRCCSTRIMGHPERLHLALVVFAIMVCYSMAECDTDENKVGAMLRFFCQFAGQLLKWWLAGKLRQTYLGCAVRADSCRCIRQHARRACYSHGCRCVPKANN